jgi:arylsulfatase
MTPFREDRWQLFHVADDINQRHDVADEHPDLVKELASAWDDAAWANQVFPLDDGTRLVHLQRPPDEHFTRPVKIVPGTPTLERYRSAQLIGSRSFQVIVDLEYGPGDQGVLVAHGGQESGYVLYVEDGALRFEFNGYGVMRSLTAPLERPCRSIVVDVTAQPKRTWDLDIRVDDQVVAGDGGYVQWAGFLPYEGIDVGVDRRSPVSWSLFERHGAFPYRGTLHSVSYVPGELAPDAGLVRLEQARALGLALD